MELFAAATTNYKTNLTTPDIVRYNSILYGITCIDTSEGYKEELMLYCKRRAMQS